MATMIDLLGNIQTLNDKINGLDFSATNVIKIPNIDIKSHFMTDRQVAKKLLMMSDSTISNIQTSFPGDLQSPSNIIPKYDEETAHLIVYGKLEYDNNGKLIDNEKVYPSCVDYNKSKTYPYGKAMPDTYMADTLISKVKNMKKELGKAVKQLIIVLKDIAKEIGQVKEEIKWLAPAIGDALAPTSPKPMVAKTLVQSVLTSIMRLQSKLLPILTLLEPLKLVSIVIRDESMESVVGSVNGLINSANMIIDLVTPITGKLTVIRSAADNVQSNFTVEDLLAKGKISEETKEILKSSGYDDTDKISSATTDSIVKACFGRLTYNAVVELKKMVKIVFIPSF